MLIACGISWLVMVPLMLDTLGIVSLGIPSQWHGLAALGPLVAAYMMHRSRDPGFRIRDLYRRQEAGRGRPAWTSLLVMTPVLFLGIALAFAFIVDGAPTGIASPGWLLRPAQLTDFVIVCVVYGFAEEPGWRGWLLPWLQERHNALRSTLIVAVIWSVWHAPFLVPGIRSGGASLPGFFIGILGAAAWLTFVFNSTRGSVVAASLWHMLWNAASLIVQPSTEARTMLGLVLAISGFGLLLLYGRRGMVAPD